MLVVGVKSNLGCEAGCGVTVSWSDPARIQLGMVSDRPRIGNDVSAVFEKFLQNFGESFCVAGAVAPRIVNSVSCVTRINHEIHFSWQAQYLVSLDNDTCYSAHCK